MKRNETGATRKRAQIRGKKDEKRGRAGLGADFVGREGADHADEDADENTDDERDDDHELVVLKRRVSGWGRRQRVGKETEGEEGGRARGGRATSPASTWPF